MSGKSYFITQLARNWENNITLEPLSQIWLVAQSISDGMRQRLTETAKELGIPLFCCPGGLSHPFFRASWSRCLKTNNLLLPDEEGRHKIESLSNNNQTNNNHKENNMTDQKNEEEEEKEKEKEEDKEDKEDKEDEEEEEEERRARGKMGKHFIFYDALLIYRILPTLFTYTPSSYPTTC